MISGFTHPTNNSCWNDPRVLFDHKDFLWCPRHTGTPRQFECTRLITPEQVIATIRHVPAFAAHAGDPSALPHEMHGRNQAMTDYNVTYNETSSGLVISNNDFAYVASGGIVNATTITGGYVLVASGGTAVSTTETGGYLAVSGGRTSVTTIGNSFASISAGGIAFRYDSNGRRH